MDLVHDDEARPRQRRAEAFAGEEDEERFRRGDQDVRRPPRHRLAGGGERVSRPHGHPNLGQAQPRLGGGSADAVQRLAQVLLDVVVQRA